MSVKLVHNGRLGADVDLRHRTRDRRENGANGRMVRPNSTLEVRCERSDGAPSATLQSAVRHNRGAELRDACSVGRRGAGDAESATDCPGSISKDPAHNHHSAVVIKLAVAYTPKGGSAASITRSIRITS